MHRLVLLSLLSLVAVAAPAHALTIYKCTNPQGSIAFQDKPCAARAHGSEFALRADPVAQETPSATPAALPRSGTSRATASSRHRSASAARTRARTPVISVESDASWECRAANGDVFYQHAPCPSAVAGSIELKHLPSRGRSRTSSTSIAVSGRVVARSDACRRIHAASASDRPGHERDEDVSTYERSLGRDRCG